jgi:hypothetical protein
MRMAAFLLMLLVVAIFGQAQSQTITGFQLLNTTSGSVIGNLANGATLYSSTLPTDWTIVALATSSTKSVAFNLDGNATFRTENAKPWSMTGDDAGTPPNYFPWKPVPSTGNHILIAIPYNQTKKQGPPGSSYSVTFSIVATAPVPAPVPAPRPAPVPAPLPAPVPAPATLRIQVNALYRQHSISPYLVGLHHEYTFTNDSAFQEGGNFVQWVKSSGVSTSRFPGGNTVKYWDWENPTGQPFIDALDPAFNASRNPPDSTWMSLDEYLAFVNKTGIMPILGVNSAHGARYNVEAEYIAKAARMVQYVKDRGFGGATWYIGNEEAYDYHGGFEGYARMFGRYASAMKAKDPTIRIFWNDNDPSLDRMRQFLQNDNGMADGMETHGKW